MSTQSQITDPLEKPPQPGLPENVPHVLLAEDDPEMRSLIARTLRSAGYRVSECADGVDLVDRLVAFLKPATPMDVDVVISDIRMPWISGLQVLAAMHEYIGFPPCILMTAFGAPEVHAQAARLKAAAVLDKPFKIEDLINKVRALTRRDFNDSNQPEG